MDNRSGQPRDRPVRPGAARRARPGVLTALSGWLAGAWSRERPWTWWALLVLQCAGVLIAPGTVRVVGAVVGLVLLLHPDSRARIDRGVPPPERTVR